MGEITNTYKILFGSMAEKKAFVKTQLRAGVGDKSEINIKKP